MPPSAQSVDPLRRVFGCVALLALAGVGASDGQVRPMNDSTAVLWVSFVPTIGGGHSSTGGIAGVGVALSFLSGRWEARLSAAGTLTPAGCAGSCPRGLGGLYDAAVTFRPKRVREDAGPFFGAAGGYAHGARAPAASLVGGIDLAVTRRILLRLEVKYTEAFTGRYIADVENPVAHHGLRQVLFMVGIGFSGPFY